MPLSFSPEFRPNEPDESLSLEHALFVEMAFEMVAYGVIALMYILTVNNLLKTKGIRSSWKMIVFLSIQQIAIFISVTGNFHMAVLAFVYNRNIPGGPGAFENQFSNFPYFYAALAGDFISSWFQDGLLIYRFVIIWGGSYHLLILPGLIFMTSIAFSFLLLIQVNPHHGLLYNGKNLPTSVIYFSLSVGLNLILTCLIAGRLMWYKRRARITLGHQHSKDYLSVAAMLVESAALYTFVGIAQIITLPISPTVSTGITGLSGTMTALAPLLIAYRVSVDQAWTRKMTKETTTLHGSFTKPSNISVTNTTTVFTESDTIALQSRGAGSVQKFHPYLQGEES